MKRRVFSLVLIASMAALWAASSAAYAQSLSAFNSDLRFMTYNINEGTDYKEIQGATTQTEFLVAIGQTITQVRATNSPERMPAIAKQIIAAKPLLIGLQEVNRWYTGPVDLTTGHCGAVTLEYDFLTELMTALRKQGAHYKVVSSAPNWELGPMPGLIQSTGQFLCVKVADRIAILARTDLDPAKFQLTNPQKGQYENVLMFPLPGPEPKSYVPFKRGWASIDASFLGQPFRFMTTHLDSVVPAINALQGGELRLGPAITSLPLIVAMDANAQAFPMPQADTYLDFMEAGFMDSWAKVFPNLPGLTCCQAQFDNNVKSQLYQRIDLILTRGPIEAQKAKLYGVTQASKTAGGLWPSDHAGVAVQLLIKPNE